MRINKYISQSGMASRREADQIISEGRVKINGTVVYDLTVQVAENDVILVDDKELPKPTGLVYYLFHKPKGYICSRKDPEGRPSVYDIIDELPYRLESVGRLDFNTSGALLFTNDGMLANSLMHPSKNIPKRYHAKIWKCPPKRQLDRIRNGLHLEDGKTKPCKLRILEQTDTENTWIEITVTEGRNRLIRRMFEAIGHPVNKLQRMSFATIALGDLPSKEFRPLTRNEIQRLQDLQTGVDPRNAGNTKLYKKGFAKPKPQKVKPLHKKKAKFSKKSKR